jgi:hypothetical protein
MKRAIIVVALLVAVALVIMLGSGSGDWYEALKRMHHR